MNQIDPPHFFITGAQRSGTTLLRLLLNSHSKIAVPEEAGFLMPYITSGMLKRRRPMSASEKLRFLRFVSRDEQFKKWRLSEEDFVVFKETELTYKGAVSLLYTTFGQVHGKAIVGDKTPKFIRKLKILCRTYPEARFIHIVRDGRDTYLSLKQRQHHSASNAALASLEWRIKEYLIGSALAEAKDRVMLVRYEDIIQSPVRQLQAITDFIGVEFEEKFLDFWTSSEAFIDKQHSDLIFQPIDPSNREKWRAALTEEEISRYDFFSRAMLRSYEYPTPDMSIPLIKKFGYVLVLLFALPKRIFRIIRVSLAMRISIMTGKPMSLRYYE